MKRRTDAKKTEILRRTDAKKTEILRRTDTKKTEILRRTDTKKSISILISREYKLSLIYEDTWSVKVREAHEPQLDLNKV